MKTIFFFISLTLLSATQRPVSTKSGNEGQLSDARFTGTTPRFSTDRLGNPMVSWAERESDKQASFYFAVSTDDAGRGFEFGPKIKVRVPATLATHAEGMPKLAQKGDGTLLALVEVPRPVPESRFAGDLLYVTSVDNGQTWSDPQPLHRDTRPGTSHSFADLTRLPNGEIGIVWLDEKRPGQEGRPVMFVQTKAGGGFTHEVVVDENACQCCRTNIFVDTQNRIHLTYRDMLPSKPGEIGARDISHVVSADAGRTFSAPAVVLADNWRVNACPHAGPSVALVGTDLFATWFSGKEDAVGLRLAKMGDQEPIALIRSNRAKHPQLTALHGQLIWVWDEAVRNPNQPADEPMPAYTQRIALRTAPDSPTVFVTPDFVNAAYPVVLPTKKGLLLAYEATNGKGANPIIRYELIQVPENGPDGRKVGEKETKPKNSTGR
jgi:hypothetical protein